MSIQLIQRYYAEVDRIIQFGGKANEAVISQKFGDLIDGYCRKRNLMLVPQIDIKTKEGRLVRPDGTIKNVLRLDYGYWESKANVDLDEEIRKKFNAGYPRTNILFEDSKTAILYQQGEETARADIRDAAALERLLTAFISYEHPEVRSFNEAVQRFRRDIPTVLDRLREMIEEQEASNNRFRASRKEFLDLCKQSINPDITVADVNEMLIQHILTEEIFVSIFSDAQFHRENNIARELYKVEETFFTGQTKRQTLDSIKDYYEMIKSQATGIVSHFEKQTFLKVIYENFYKAYNPKGADRLGIVYTPNEIVKFMIEGTDWLLHKHFGVTLGEKNVEILDPATGTGTFICDIIDYLPKEQVVHKYRNELHANEIAILPYYIANLNIEYIFKQKTGYYEEFPNICFVDTLDNTGGLQHSGHQQGLFGFSAENAARIKAQNERKISVIIGNPPYNANQQNENDNNKNREYPVIDKRIKATYIAASTAQKTKLYDMYARFYRWASDRLDKNGVLALITNRSFIDSRTFDGFRKCIMEEFEHALIVDTRSDVRANPRISGTAHNVFGIQAGVAIMFLVRKKGAEKKHCGIDYFTLQDEQRREEKLDWFRTTKLRNIDFQRVYPDVKNNWINQADNDFESLLPLVDKEVKAGKAGEAVFQLFSLGVVTARDEWVYAEDDAKLNNKVNSIMFTPSFTTRPTAQNTS
jgi:predicted helicase